MARRWSLGLPVLLLTLGVLLAQQTQKPEEKPGAAATAPTAQKSPHNYNLKAEDKALKNPVAFNENSVARGKKLYQSQCAMCHGENADGKGEAVEEMKISPPDFTKAETLKDRTDGELFVILGVGSDTMPGQGSRLKDKQKWDLVNYLRAVGGKIPEKSTGKEPEENVILVPQKPEQGTGVRSQKSEVRSQKLVSCNIQFLTPPHPALRTTLPPGERGWG